MTVEERLAAVERALTDDETEPAALSDAATVEGRLDAIEERLDDFERRLADAEAGIDAVRGHVGHEQSAIEDVERTAATALSTARRVERRHGAETDSTTPGSRAAPPLPERAVDRTPESDPPPDRTADEGQTAPRRILARLFDS